MMRGLKLLVLAAMMIGLVFGTALAGEADGDRPLYLWTTVNIDEPDVELSGRWLEVDEEQSFGGLEATTTRSAAYAEFTFEGTGVRWIGSTGINRGMADVYLNDELVAEGVDSYRTESEYGVVLFEKLDLDEGVHTLRVDPTGEAHEDATLANVNVDAFAFIPTLGEVIGDAEALLDEVLVEAPQHIGEQLVAYYPREARDALSGVLPQFREILKDPGATQEDEQEAIIGLRKAEEEFRATRIAPAFPDRSENDRTAYVEGSPTWLPGRRGKALYLDGVADYVQIDTGTISRPMTFEFWLYPSSSNILAPASSPQEEGYLHFYRHSEGYYYIWSQGEEDRTNLNSETITENNTWHHVALVFDDEGRKIYVDGRLDAEDELLSVDQRITAIGTRDYHGDYADLAYFWEGLIDEVRIWDVARTEEELQEMMDGELKGEEEGLIAYWTFDELLPPEEPEE